MIFKPNYTSFLKLKQPDFFNNSPTFAIKRLTRTLLARPRYTSEQPQFTTACFRFAQTWPRTRQLARVLEQGLGVTLSVSW